MNYSDPARASSTTSVVSYREIINSALQVARRSVEHDEEFVIFPRSAKDQKAAVRELALSERSISMSDVLSGPSIRQELRKRSLFAADCEPPWTSSSPAMKQAVKRFALEGMSTMDRQPYTMGFRAGLTERHLPTVSGTLRLEEIDAAPEDISGCVIRANSRLWDSECHTSIITETTCQLQQYLQQDEHDPYRDARGSKVQVEGHLGVDNPHRGAPSFPMIT